MVCINIRLYRAIPAIPYVQLLEATQNWNINKTWVCDWVWMMSRWFPAGHLRSRKKADARGTSCVVSELPGTRSKRDITSWVPDACQQMWCFPQVEMPIWKGGLKPSAFVHNNDSCFAKVARSGQCKHFILFLQLVASCNWLMGPQPTSLAHWHSQCWLHSAPQLSLPRLDTSRILGFLLYQGQTLQGLEETFQGNNTHDSYGSLKANDGRSMF